jgi:hypothetical protein
MPFLKIRNEQLRAFEGLTHDRFEERVREFVMSRWPALLPVPEPAALTQLVSEGVAHARVWGLRTERDTVLFMLVRIALGPDFDSGPSHPWAVELAGDASLDGPRKLERLLARAAENHRAPSPSPLAVPQGGLVAR